MKTRTISVPLLVLVAVVALVLGSLGTATAAGLTTKKVKKIAAKVVDKKATSLSVASATNASNLAGKPASAYLDESRVFTTTVTTAAFEVVIPLPLTTGSYYVSYHAYLYNGSGASGCYLRQKAGAVYLGYLGDDIGTGSSPAFSGSAVAQLAPGQTLELYCWSGGQFSTLTSPAPDPIQVVVTPLDGVTTTAITPARPAGSGGRP